MPLPTLIDVARLTLQVPMVLCLLMFSSCARQQLPTPVSEMTVPDAEWQSRVQQVRDGQSTNILEESLPVATAQFEQLQTVLNSLKRLEIDQSLVAPEVFRSTLAGMTNLERLKLMGPVTDEDLRTIASLPHLEILNLPQARITDAGLGALIGHPALNFLRINAPRVTDAGMDSIRRIPKLRFLHLIGVPITDAGLPHLADLDRLESFYLDGSMCTEAGLSKLIQQLPELHFHWNQLHLPNDPQADH